MNNTRRKELKKALALMAEARSIIEEMVVEEQEALDNLPESIQEGDMGTQMAANAESLEELAESLEEHESELEDVIYG